MLNTSALRFHLRVRARLSCKVKAVRGRNYAFGTFALWTLDGFPKYQEKLNYFLFEIYRHLRGTLKGLRHRSGMNISMVPVVAINYSAARDYACPPNAIAKNYCLQFSKDNRKTLTELPTEIIHKYRAYLTGSKLVKKSEIQTMIDVWKYLLVRYDCLV